MEPEIITEAQTWLTNNQGLIIEYAVNIAAALIEGVELTLRELTNVMTKHGITMISPAVGDQFDPQLHQAMFEAPVPGTKAGQIIQVMTEGFMLHDRLLRPASVPVLTAKPGRIEIVLRGGRRIIVEGAVDADTVLTLARGLEALR